MEQDVITILDYRAEHQPYFESFNRAWIEKHFWLEEIDRNVLQRPEEFIISKGGVIIMAACNDVVCGTVALKKVDGDVYEFTKMAVDEHFRGKGIGEALSVAALQQAKTLGAKKVILYSQTGLVPALTMYRKLGFVEVTMGTDVYKRSDIKMEIYLTADRS